MIRTLGRGGLLLNGESLLIIPDLRRLRLHEAAMTRLVTVQGHHCQVVSEMNPLLPFLVTDKSFIKSQSYAVTAKNKEKGHTGLPLLAKLHHQESLNKVCVT